VNQFETCAAVLPLLSSQTGTGEKPRPTMRYCVSTVLPAAVAISRSPAFSIRASPAGSSGSLCCGAFSNARASTPNISGGALSGR
jgi:hypothetical protein